MRLPKLSCLNWQHVAFTLNIQNQLSCQVACTVIYSVTCLVFLIGPVRQKIVQVVLHQYCPAEPLLFLFTPWLTAFSCSPSRNCQSRLVSGQNNFWATILCVRMFSGAISPVLLGRPTVRWLFLSIKVSFILLWPNSLCDTFAERRTCFSSVRPSGRVPYFCTRKSRRPRLESFFFSGL